MKLHELSPAEGSKKSVKRIGRGTCLLYTSPSPRDA